MKIIGLTGPSGAGKGTLCQKFEELDIPCIDTDAIYHSLVTSPSPCLDELKERFGSSIINTDGSLNRTSLAKLVFAGDNAKESLEALNYITHKYVWDETNIILTNHIKMGKKCAVIDAPALFSSQFFVGACDFIISVLCDKEIRVERIVKRDNISREQALARINAQPSEEFFVENSDYCITNCGSIDYMNKQLISILEQEEIYP